MCVCVCVCVCVIFYRIITTLAAFVLIGAIVMVKVARTQVQADMSIFAVTFGECVTFPSLVGWS